ncbi:MAG: hypothetical protein N3D82_01750 [Ignisphaera sp.]|nr:hypothetical protein [Ignisphaera sp.]MCX8167743.1 hypothetical protein [Ignisphaera sp.]MDW8085306.1 hypothetical protein [Ignisphaera sp.]
MSGFTRNKIVVGVVLATIAVATIAVVVYAQQNPLSGSAMGCCNVVRNAARDVIPLLLRFRWGRNHLKNHLKLQHFVEISEEYRAKVISILKNDPDTGKLLEEGYNITMIKPLPKMHVQGDGSVVIRATQAYVYLRKNTAGRVVVLVDIGEGKVLKILQFQFIEKG